MLLLFEVKIVLKTSFSREPTLSRNNRFVLTDKEFHIPKRFCQTNKHTIILRASDWFFDTSGLEQNTRVAKRGLVEFPFARSTVSRTMSAADFDSLDFITFRSDASRSKVRDFGPYRILCKCLTRESMSALKRRVS